MNSHFESEGIRGAGLDHQNMESKAESTSTRETKIAFVKTDGEIKVENVKNGVVRVLVKSDSPGGTNYLYLTEGEFGARRDNDYPSIDAKVDKNSGYLGTPAAYKALSEKPDFSEYEFKGSNGTNSTMAMDDLRQRITEREDEAVERSSSIESDDQEREAA